MPAHPLAGKPAPRSLLVNVPRLVAAYYTEHPDPTDPACAVSFGTSGHRGVSFNGSFNEDHILAITQAVCEYRAAQGVTGPLFVGMDTHALSEPAFITTVEVLAANSVAAMIQKGRGYTPTPVISHAILTHNKGRTTGLADGVVITPSHNPPDSGGFKYNPPRGGPADTSATKAIQDRANELLRAGLAGVRRMPFARALAGGTTVEHDYVAPYVADLANVVDMAAIRDAGLVLGVDPMGGSGIAFWEPMAAHYGLKLELVNDHVDPTFGFMTVDKDGKIRMDCSSPYAMAGLIHLKDRFDVAFGNDPDYDRHGIVTPRRTHEPQPLSGRGHQLPVPQPARLECGRGGGQDRGFQLHDRPRGRGPGPRPVRGARGVQVVRGRTGGRLLRLRRRRERGRVVFAQGRHRVDHGQGWRHHGPPGRRDHGPHGQEPVAAVRGADRAVRRAHLRNGWTPPATPAQKKAFSMLTPDMVAATELAGEPITARLTHAPGNGASIGGLKVVTANGWFAARPSGTEDVYKIYAESFLGPDHLQRIKEEARAIVGAAFAAAGS